MGSVRITVIRRCRVFRVSSLETIVPDRPLNNVGLIGYRRTRDHEPSSARGRQGAGRGHVSVLERVASASRGDRRGVILIDIEGDDRCREVPRRRARGAISAARRVRLAPRASAGTDPTSDVTASHSNVTYTLADTSYR